MIIVNMIILSVLCFGVQRLEQDIHDKGCILRCDSTGCCLFFQNVMTSQVLRNHLEATYITVESTSFYGVKAEPSRVLVNSQDAEFTYRANQVR